MGIRITVLAAALLSALPVQGDDCSSLDPIRWLVGEWTTAGEGKQVLESWTAISPNTFEGLGAVRSGETGEFTETETLRLVAMSGSVYYIAKVPENDLPVPFEMTSCGEGLAVFRNPSHDFPKRLTYRLTGPDRMSVSVSGDREQGFTLNFHRRQGPERK